MKSEHTPGPWKVEAGLVVASSLGWKGAIIAKAMHHDLGSNTHDALKAEANARLIAAAPALLKAARRLLEEFDDASVPDDMKLRAGWSGNTVNALYMARAAIAKAEGGTE